MADYKSTLNITQTSFPMKANLPQNEPERMKLWEQQGFYEKGSGRVEAPQYVLHDGPPFANGDIHMGHALNKVLKDIIVKYHVLKGFDSPYVPGWDCHGMPIEHKVVEQLGSKARTMTKVEIRNECRKYAEKFLNRQRDEFKRLGILGDFNHPYLTMDPTYELSLVQALTRLVGEGYVSRRLRPIHWCPVCRTALAEAEVEYSDHESLAVTVAFAVKNLPIGVLPKSRDLKDLSILIWTTTPWTLPANLGISVHPDFEYVVVKAGGARYLLAKVLLPQTAKACGWDPTKIDILEECKGKALDRALCRHPFLDQDSLVMVGEHVTADTGTGCVHTAPGHGREDYEIGLKYGLPVYSPVDEAGRYDERVKGYAGMSIWEANGKIVEQLKDLGRLLSFEKIRHSYPHCWRSKNPIIFRATAQWFIELDHKDLRQRCLEEIEKVEWIPSWGKDRIKNMVAGRTDWCISRQRSWGVPITVIYCKICGKIMDSPEVLTTTIELVKKEGIDGWLKRNAAEILTPGTVCSCGSKELVREEDILDVWFESGSSHFAVMDQREELQGKGAFSRYVLYLEGSDQHRGWFQHALWTGVALKGKAPFNGVLTHGWVLDAEGKAMHKSAGNVIDPLEMVKKYGADVLRLWVSSEDYTEDVGIGEEMLNRMSEAYRRIRNTFRFILGNLSDFDPAAHSADPEDLLPLDRWARVQSQKTLASVTQAYDQYQFTKVFHQIDQFFSVSLSAGYFDILKDRLYTFEAGSQGRRSAQTVLYGILKDYVVVIAPILSFTAEEIWQCLSENFKDKAPTSVFKASWPSFEVPAEEGFLQEWEWIFTVKGTVLKSLEGLRQSKTIGSSLEGEVDLYVFNEQLKGVLQKNLNELRYYFLVSQVALKEGEAPSGATEDAQLKVKAFARKSMGIKCARCWNYYPFEQMDGTDPQICHRCGPVVAKFKASGSQSA